MDDSREAYVEWKGWTEDRFAQFDRHAARYYAWHMRRALGERAALQILEIGFGNGAFLGYCRHRAWDVTAIELDPGLRERALRAGFATLPSVEALPAQARFDLIALFDVLEHVPAADCVAFMRSLGERLHPEGAILLRVPNGDSPFGRRHQHGDLTHVCTFGEFKLKQLAQLCGLKVVALGEAPWHSQQLEGRTLKCLRRAATRALLNRLLGFAYFGSTVDLAPNLAAVLTRAGSSRPAIR